MTIPNSTASTAENASSRLPEEEKRIVSELATNSNEPDSYFAVSKRWYASWRKYVNTPLGGGAAAPRPGPIDNSDIIETDPYLGRKSLAKEKAYVLVTQLVWNTLLEWYSGGPPIPRTFIYLYLSDSRDDDDDNDDNEVTDIRLPKEASIRELYEMVCAKTVVSLEKAHIRDYYDMNKGELLDPLSNKSLEESGLVTNQDILLEVDERGLAGLVNLGNTCYMNSAVQCLAHTPPIHEYFLRDHTHQGELAKAFGKLLTELWSSGTNAVAPRVFKKKVDKAAPQFTGHYQHDSHELLLALLTGLHQESDIVNVFQGQCKSSLVCPVCGETANTYDSFTSLSLPLPSTPTPSISLISCLEGYLAEEPLGPDNMWLCPQCKDKRQANKKLDLWKLPEILVFQLKRFKTSKYFLKKIDTFVDFPVDELDLSKYVEKGESCLYELYAVCNHDGGIGLGHYTAYAKMIDDDNEWYCYDDSLVSPVDESEIKSKAAYLLFYRRRVGSESAEVSMTDDMDLS
ncbi:unnamed protein product [Brassica oleracea]|uniref:Ubiquitin carboxyl-terminal hydrolase n=2 Tax=Brassica oleracea TaxID=3712 RepID=A0A0D3C4F3_BRAOL|nr:PREDICTED: ubiquitin carboxyl-terminal hydrolase 10-like [Brassica oleracea var. oleracea]VDD15051.1 unnamed protein product [Brassica oleracea]